MARRQLATASDVTSGAAVHRAIAQTSRRPVCPRASLSSIKPRTRPVDVGGPSPDFLTTWIVDPDGNRIELMQWPPGHGVGMSAADCPG